MTLIVAAKRGTEVACISDTMGTTEAVPDQPSRRIRPTLNAAFKIPDEDRYVFTMHRKTFRVADQAFVLMQGDMNTALDFVRELRDRCSGANLGYAAYCEACERSSEGRQHFAYLAISQLDEGPKIYGPPGKINVLTRHGIEFYFAGSGSNDFIDYFRYTEAEMDLEPTGGGLSDFFHVFGAIKQGTEYLTGMGVRSRWGAAFEYLNNRTGVLALEDKLLVHLGVAGRMIDGQIGHAASGDWLSYQFYRGNYLVVFAMPLGGQQSISIAREFPGDLNLIPARPGEVFSAKKVTSILKGSRYDYQTAVAQIFQAGATDELTVETNKLSAEVFSIADVGFLVMLQANATPGGGGFKDNMRDDRVWLPRLNRAATFLEI